MKKTIPNTCITYQHLPSSLCRYAEALLLLLIWANPAAAYIDPGTGGALSSHIGTILAAAATAIITAAAFLRNAIKNALTKIVRNLASSSNKATFAFILVITISATMALHNYRSNYANGGTMQKTKRVIIIGIDGFDPDIMEYLMLQGKLPNFKRLATTGSYHRLPTIDPPISPVVWTTIATSTTPDNHNIYDFIKFNKKEMLPHLSVIEQKNTITGTHYTSPIKAKTFWDEANENGARSAIIRWPLTFPATKTNGTMISGFGTPDIKGYLGGYTLYTDDTGKNHDTEELKQITTDPSGQQIATIYGPLKIGGKPSQIEMLIKKKSINAIQVTIQGRQYDLLPHFWGPWMPLEFKTSPGQTIKAQTRLYLEKSTPHIELFMTSLQADPQNPSMPIAYPDSYSKQLALTTRESFYTLGMPEDIKAVNDEKLSLRALLQQAGQIHKERAAMFMEAYEHMINGDLALIATVFDETDRVQHMTVATEVTREKEAVINIGPSIEQIYVEKDEFIGDIMNRLPENTALMIISDHGFKTFTKTININTWLQQNGYLVASQTPSAKSKPLYKDVLWDCTKAYSYGYIGININLKGRERAGTITKAAKKQIEQEITQKLYNMTDPATGSKIIDKVITTSGLYNGPFAKNAPDLVILPRPPYRIDWESPIGQISEKAIADNIRLWKADHMFGSEYVPGIFFSNFKVTRQPAVWDIAPTIADLMGKGKANTYIGKSLIKETAAAKTQAHVQELK